MATDLYGTDLSTFAGVGNAVGADPLFLPISGPRVVLEAVARRLMTPRGALPRHPGYGYDLLSLCSKRMTTVARKRAEADIKAECEQDPRVLSATVVEFAEVAGAPHRYRLRISLELAEGPFDLVLGIGDVTVTMLRAA